ncbi:MAG TPA: hypothetical protein PLM29_07515 [Deltaproteobacteria bacterium]|nr:hypothetical protein [Deltaproteobacteria bacterium]
MLAKKLIELLENSGEELTQRIMKDLLTREETRHLRDLRQNRVYGQVYDVYTMLISWLSGEKTKGKIIEHYIELGRQRYNEGFPLSEILMVFMLIKRHLWLFAIEKKAIDPAFELHQVLELNNRVVFFFDRIIYCTSVGYEKENKEDSFKL